MKLICPRRSFDKDNKEKWMSSNRVLLFLRMAFSLICIALCVPCSEADDEIEALVKALVSSNPKPDIVERGRLRVPEGFDRSHQKRIITNWDQLLSQDSDSLPTLIAHYDDTQYSTSIASVLTEHWQNWTVGEVCHEIVISRLEPYGKYSTGAGDPRERPRRPSYCKKYLDTKDRASQWWREHRKLTLREIQLEALDWIIEEEKKQDKQLFAEVIVFLEQIRKKLASSTVPLEAPELGYSLIFRLGGNEGK